MNPLIGLLFLSSFVFIFLKAFQQLNVTKGHYFWVVPTSFLMATVEVFLIAEIGRQGYGWELVVAVGTGSGLGAVSSMYIHQRFIHGRRGR